MAKHTKKLIKKKLSRHFSKAKINKTSNVHERKPEDNILNYSNLCTKFKSCITEYLDSWNAVLEDSLILYKIDVSDQPSIVASIKIDTNLKVCAFTQNGRVKPKYLYILLNEYLVLEYWSQLKILMEYLGNKDVYSQVRIKHNLSQVSKCLRECLESRSLAEGKIGLKAKIKFIFSQIFAITENRYNPDIIILAYSLYIKSSSCYRYLQKLESIILPKEEDLIEYINKI